MNLRRLPVGVRGAIVAVAGGVLIPLPWLDERLFPAAWLGMTLMIAVTLRAPPWLAFRLWLLCGLCAMAVTFHWIPQVAARQLEVGDLSSLTVGLLAWTWDAFRFGVFGYLVTALRPRSSAGILIWPVAWVGLEWVFPHVFPWQIGLTQLGCLPLCQIAELTGACGVSFLFVWWAAAAAASLIARSDEPGVQARNVTQQHFAVCTLILAAVAAWGTAQIDQIEQAAKDCPKLDVAVVQPGALDESTPKILRELSASVPEDTNLVIWGESSVGEFSTALNSFRFADKVQANARNPLADQQPCPGLGRALLCAGCSFVPGTTIDEPSRNTAYLIDAEETIVGRYHKRVLMPWGEYAVGQQWVPGLRDLLADSRAFVPGESAAPLKLPDGTGLGVLVCYEDMHSTPARETVQEGAACLVSLHNLSTFGRTAAQFQHQQCARFRAIENRRWLVRCGTTGISSVIAATGRVERQAIPHAPLWLPAAIPLSSSCTLYTRVGDIFAGACLAATLIMVVVRRFGRRRESAVI